MSKKTIPFIDRVYKALTTKPQSSRAIAAKLKLNGDDAPSVYHCAKVTKAVNELIAAGKAAKLGNFRTAEYIKSGK